MITGCSPPAGFDLPAIVETTRPASTSGHLTGLVPRQLGKPSSGGAFYQRSMSNQTLRLPRTAEKAEAPTLRMPTAEEVALYFAAQRAAGAPDVDWKYDSPVVVAPVNLSALPPAGSRNSDPVQVPARVWGDPSLLKPSAAPGPQPLFTPPRGK